jgi:hypothetical protein
MKRVDVVVTGERKHRGSVYNTRTAILPGKGHTTVGVYLTDILFIGVHLTSVHLMNVHLTGVHLMRIHSISVCLMGVHLTSISFASLRRAQDTVARIPVSTPRVFSKLLIVGDSAVRLLVTLGTRSAW